MRKLYNITGMGVFEALGSALGIGVLAGIRLYGTVLALGLAIRCGAYTPLKAMADLSVLADTRVLAAAGLLCAIEFLADKIPWLDSVWDSFHTFIRPIGAALLAFTAFGEMNPVAKTLLVLATGAAALAGHSSKAATRLAANHSPEPFTNLGLSLLEDLMAPAGLYLTLAHPVLAFSIFAIFLGLFLWLSPKIFRLLRLEMTALLGAVHRGLGAAGQSECPTPAVARLFSSAPPALTRLPAEYRAALREKETLDESAGIFCAATGTIRGLRHSIGYLCIGPEKAVFVTRRLFRFRTFPIALNGAAAKASWKTGIFLDTLAVGDHRFDVFKAPR